MAFWTNISVMKNDVLVRDVDENGNRRMRKVKYRPTLYAPCSDDKKTHSSIDGRPVQAVEFDSMSSARQALKDGTWHGFDRLQYGFIAEEWPEDVVADMDKIKVSYLDIETMADDGFPDIDQADKEVTMITFSSGETFFSFACFDWTPSDPRVRYVRCVDEAQLLDRFLTLWGSVDHCPDIMSGWNIEHFDIPYLVNRINRVLGEGQANRLSPWRKLEEKTVFLRGEDKKTFSPVGISVLDYQKLYHKLAVMTRAADTPDDYKLNTIAHNELKVGKLDYSQYQSLHDMFVNDPQRYADYNVVDVDLVKKINSRRQLIEQVVAMAHSGKTNFEDILGSVRQWECIIHHRLLAQGVVLPPRKRTVAKELVGAFVKDPPPGAYDWVVSFDLASLYSHLIMQYNISPETRVGRLEKTYTIDEILDGALEKYRADLQDSNVIVSANCRLFRRDVVGFLPAILEQLYQERQVAKANTIEARKKYEETKDKRWLDDEARWKLADKALKVQLNSAYGCITNAYFIFYDHENAEAITTGGQLGIRWVANRINEFLNETLRTQGQDFVIASDTDSVFINLGGLVEKYMPGREKSDIVDFLDKLCAGKLQDVINRAYDDLAQYVNASRNKLTMNREVIVDRGIWVGKKHYALSMLDKEGVRYAEPKIEIKGMAAVKSSTPPACREKIKDAIKLIMANDREGLTDLTRKFREEHRTLPFHEVAFPRSVSEMDKWLDANERFRDGVPIQVRAAVTYNRTKEKMGLVSYPPIFDGDKIKYAYMLTPNPFGENVMGSSGPVIPGVLEYLDRDLMYEKGFVVPIQSILDAVGWGQDVVNQGSTLEDFFGAN